MRALGLAALALVLLTPTALSAQALPELAAQAQARIKDGDYDGAIALFRARAAAAPMDAVALYDLGVAYATMNMNRQALVPPRRAVQIDPTYLDAWRVLAIAHGFTGARQEALAATTAAAELGSVNDMFEAGEMYAKGVGTRPDPASGLMWIERAAVSGHIGAMERLGRVHLDGEYGVERDEAKGQAWLFRAREEGKRIEGMSGGGAN
jgi:TPR repeat protein